MKTERELFFYELEGRGFSFKDKSYDEFGFHDEVLNMVWEMWQAATQREGFKLVPVELPDDTSDNVWGDLNCKSVFNEDCDGFIPHEDIDLGQIYKAMIGACDD